MKKQFITIALLSAFTAPAVFAQATAPIPTTPATVNPFTGVTAPAETSKKSLDMMKLQTQMHEEMVKQRALELELANLPVKKQAEVAPAITALEKLETDRKERERVTAERAASAAKAAQDQEIARKAAAAAAKRKEPVSAAAPRVREPDVQLVSVTKIGSDSHAVFEVDGVAVMFSDGQATPLGNVKITGANTVQLGNRLLKVHSNTLSRMVITDVELTEEEQAAGKKAAPIASVQPMPGNPLSGGNSTSLPPPTVPVTPQMLEQLGITAPSM